jgi:hypothetical protein
MESVTLTANGKTYALQPLGTNELCTLEEQLGKNFGVVLAEIGALGIERMRLSTVRIFLKTCLTSDDDITVEEIGELIDALGFDGISAAINGLIQPAREVVSA